MTKTERCNQPCPREMPCIGEACQYHSMEYCYCDVCLEKHNGENPASYEWDGDHYCEDCLNDFLNMYFNENYTLDQKMEMVDCTDRDFDSEDKMLAYLRNAFNELPISEKIEQLELDGKITKI